MHIKQITEGYSKLMTNNVEVTTAREVKDNQHFPKLVINGSKASFQSQIKSKK